MVKSNAGDFTSTRCGFVKNFFRSFFMSQSIYVGNLPYSTREEDLREVFEAHGNVENVKIIRDRETGRSRGFGFVEMSTEEETNAAISALNGSELGGRTLKVSISKPRNDR